MPPVLMQRKGQFTLLSPLVSLAVIHSDGVSERAFAPRASIKSQALEEEMKTNFPIFGGSIWQDGIIPLSEEL